jgi:RHS repeat-associated protein
VSNPAIQAAPLLQQTYTPDGIVGSLTDANNNTTSFTPDGFDRLSSTTYPDSSAENLAYDADSNVLTRQTRAGPTITFTYDTLNRLASKAAPSEPTVTYGYDLAGRATSVTDTSAAIVAPSGPVAYATNFAYDALNRPTNISWSPALAAASPATSGVTFTHSYNNANQRSGQGTTDNTWFNYPTAAAPVSYTANNLNQYTAVNAVTPSYDGNGNLTYDGTFTYCYDAENRMTAVLSAGTCAAPGTTVATYAYDAQGRRKSKTVGGVTTMFVTDADNREVLEYDGSSGAVQNWYAYGLGPNAVLNQNSVAAGTRTTLVPDILGSTIATLDAASGTLTKVAYGVYGEGQTSGNFLYTGQRIDPETNGLYYYRARHYMPAWGRFMQADPIGYTNGSNLFAYVGNDPLNALDPDGLLSLWGVARFVGGSLEAGIGVGFGVATGWTGLGAVAGAAIALHGVDVAVSGLRETDSFTSQGLQAAGLSQNVANAVDTGISGAAFIAAGNPILPYSLFGSPLAGGGVGTSLLSATARGFIVPGLEVGNESNVAFDALQAIYGTGTNAAAVGRAASDVSIAAGAFLEGFSAGTVQGGVIGSAQGAEADPSQGAVQGGIVGAAPAPNVSVGQGPAK